MYLVFLWFKLKFAKITTSTSLLSFTIFIFENYRHFRLKLRGKSHFVTFKMKNQRSIFKCATVKICLLWNVNHTRCKKLPVSKKKHSTRLWLMKLYVTNETSCFPVCNQWNTLFPVCNKWSTLLPVCNKWNTLLPVCYKRSTLFPVCNKRSTLLQVCNKRSTILPVCNKRSTFLRENNKRGKPIIGI